MTKSGIKSFDFAVIKSKGLEKIVTAIIEHIKKVNLDGFWINFDTNVISDEENSAVDYRLS